MEKLMLPAKINRLLRLLALFIAVSSINVFSMDMPIESEEQLEKGQYQQLIDAELGKKRGLLIFLDDTKTVEIDSIARGFLSACYQEVGPIIVSTSILYNVLQEGKKDTRSNEELKDEMIKVGFRTDIFRKNNDILVSRICFKPQNWIIKKINDSLSLLIAKKQLSVMNIDENKVIQWNKALDEVSDVELQLGLNVNHMETIDFEGIVKPDYMVFADYFIDSLQAIFCRKSDYRVKNMTIPEWFIYIAGHGYTNRRIVALSLDGFQSLLQFLSSQINTGLLFVSSCFAMGVNSRQIYEETPFGLQKQYPFPIIVEGLNDVSVNTTNPQINLYYGDTRYSSSTSENEIQNLSNFAHFLQMATGLEPNYGQMAKSVRGGSFDGAENTPQIKLPGMEWFSVMDVDKKIVSIGSILSQTRNPEKSLDMATYFKRAPEVLLLYTDDIPFELKVNHSKLRAIVSMVSSGAISDKPDLVLHRIKKISSTGLFSTRMIFMVFTSILGLFKLVAEAEGSKIFFIDEIYDQKDIVIFGTRDDMVKVYFKDKNGIPFTMELGESGFPKAEKIIKDSADEHDYLQKIKLATIEYPQARAASQTRRVTPEGIKRIQDVYSEQHLSPGPRGKRMYEALKQ